MHGDWVSSSQFSKNMTAMIWAWLKGITGITHHPQNMAEHDGLARRGTKQRPRRRLMIKSDNAWAHPALPRLEAK
jgi:hypothetical protein